MAIVNHDLQPGPSARASLGEAAPPSPAEGNPALVEELPWLPPVPLVLGHLAHAASWGLLVAFWAAGKRFDSLAGFAWPHMAGLAWLSVISLSVLFHVVPGFLDVRIPAERFARVGVALAWLGGVGLAVAFWLERTPWLPWAGAVAIAGILASGVPLGLAILSHQPESQGTSKPAPLVPAFLAVMGSLLLAALLGGYLATALAGLVPGTWFVGILPSHAHLAAGGWLSLLVFGVSTRTMRRILGAPAGKLHGAASGVFFAGVLLLGLAWLAPGSSSAWISWIGGVLAALGALLYAAETAGRIARARGRHRGPRLFIGASAFYLGITAILGLGTLGGLPWGRGYAFLAIAGWIGQMLNGHLLHIATRFLLTMARGPDDETEPVDVLSPRLTTAAWLLFQAAVLAGTAAGLALRADLAALSGALGLAGWVVFSSNYVVAWRRAVERIPPDAPGAKAT